MRILQGERLVLQKNIVKIRILQELTHSGWSVLGHTEVFILDCAGSFSSESVQKGSEVPPKSLAAISRPFITKNHVKRYLI